jgi:hypothetical protein
MVQKLRWCAGCFTVLLALQTQGSPTDADFIECHEIVSSRLLECLNDSPGKLELICLDQSRIMLKACYTHVYRTTSPQRPTAGQPESKSTAEQLKPKESQPKD